MAFIIGIDATNLTGGGGLTHLTELLNVADPKQHEFEKIIIYGSKSTLNRIRDRHWLIKKTHILLSKGFWSRLIYLLFIQRKELKKDEVNIFFVPGGTYLGSFRPFVTMCQNMLVFEQEERKRVGWNKIRMRLKLLEKMQTKTFSRATEVIFLSKYARNYTCKLIGLNVDRPIVHHGISSRFSQEVKPQKAITEYSEQHPYKFLYVSIIDFYKHQVEVIEAVHRLRTENNIWVELHLVGDAIPASFQKMQEKINQLGCNDFVTYHGVVKYDKVDEIYKSSDAFIFASSCENMPNILIEAMHVGLPIASSSRGPMPEFLKDAGVYFDPYNPDEIYQALNTLIMQPTLRYSNAAKAKLYSDTYDWFRCANETFMLLNNIVISTKRRIENS